MVKRHGSWRTATKCKVCEGSGKIPDPEDPDKKVSCYAGCEKGWFYAKGLISS